MSEWTEAARRVLDDYCARSRAGLAGSGADADEVIEDLRRHVEEELQKARLNLVAEEDVRRLLARIGELGNAPKVVPSANPSDAPLREAEGLKAKKPGMILLALGVVFPLITMVFEFMTGSSAGVLFDPFPNWIAVIAVALVPLANLWILLAARQADPRRARLLGWLNSAAIGVCLYYSILYLPFAPMAAVGVIFYGLGLIPLTPFMALIATPFLRQRYVDRIGGRRLGGGLGAVLAVGILVLLQVPILLTHFGLAQAASEDSEIQKRGVRLLRTIGDEELMLRACYGFLRRELDMDVVRILGSGNRVISAEQAREVYFRVTGRPFNSVPAPSLYTRLGRWNALDQEFTWDDALGGEAVAGRVKGLSLASSRMDAVAEPDAALVYCEWTMEFKNVSTQQREARAQISLPPGAVVSRVTLWINGEEREAAFGGRSQVRQAYQEVAVVQRRDPVLVNTCGPDRVLMQCFPVPPNGNPMKVRIGITAPLVLASAEQGRFLWPRFLERNFTIAPDLKHACWIESTSQLSGTDGVTGTNPGSLRPRNWHASVSEVNLVERNCLVDVQRSADVKEVSSPADSAGEIVRQTIRAAMTLPSPRLVLVVDTSAAMRSFLPEIAEALAGVPASAEISVILAGDVPQALRDKPVKAEPAVLEGLRRSLRRANCAGGQDNVPALEEAWDLAAGTPGTTVVWVHLPQPVLLSAGSALVQRMERMAGGARLCEIQALTGPDRVLEKLDGLVSVTHVPRFGTLGADLKRLLEHLGGKSGQWELVRERVAAAPVNGAHAIASKHVARLWARDETLRLAAARNPAAAMQLAAEYQLVTPVTGAVVLETKQQYDRHGLKSVDPTTAPSIPAVPEPGTWVLIGVGMGTLLLVRWTRRLRTKIAPG